MNDDALLERKKHLNGVIAHLKKNRGDSAKIKDFETEVKCIENRLTGKRERFQD